MKREELLTDILDITPGIEDKKLIQFLKKPELAKVYGMIEKIMKAQKLHENLMRVDVLHYLAENFPEEKARIKELQGLSPEDWNKFIEERKNTPCGIDISVHGNKKLIARVMFYPQEMKVTARYLSYKERKELKYI